MGKKKIEPICNNCRLYDARQGICRVVILMEGKRLNIPVDAKDRCFFENEVEGTNGKFVPAEDIKEVRFWVENPITGEKTNGNGIVKMEYPEGFFGKQFDVPSE
jgi:hypothetical protein